MAGTDLRAVRVLDGSGAPVWQVGAKAAALDRMIGLDLPVPMAAVLDTAIYREVASHPEVAAVIDRIRAAPAPGEAERQAVDAAFLAATLPAGLPEKLEMAMRAVCPDGQPLAARSSATAEDSASVSFAGQYRSFLNVRTAAELQNAVRLVWASLWHPAPTLYRRHWNVPDTDLAMGVLLMRQVRAVTAGVAFTVDPTSGRDLVRIECVSGTADRLVGGELTPTVLQIPRVGPVADNVQVPVDEIRRLVLEVEAAFGGPQDVEWASDGQQVFLVQARPMTTAHARAETGDGFDVVPSEPATLVTAGISEMLPGPLPPLIWESNSFLVEESLRGLFDGLGTLPDQLTGPHEVVARVGGQARLNFDVLRRVADATPGASVVNLERQYFGAPTESRSRPPANRASVWAAVRRDARAAQVRRRAVGEGLIAAAASREIVASAVRLDEFSDNALLCYRSRLVDLGARSTAAEAAVSAAAVASYQRLEARLASYVNPDEAVRLGQVLTRQGRDVRGDSAPPWQRLHAIAHDFPEVGGALSADISWQAAREQLNLTAEGRRFLEELEVTARTAGSMSVFAGPTWAEDMALAWQAAVGTWLRRHLTANEGVSDQRTAAVNLLAASPRWKRERLIGAMLVNLPRLLLEHQLRDARRLLAEREQFKRTLLQLGGEVRRVHLELGHRLMRRGHLSDSRDVDYMSGAELTAAVAGRGPGPLLLAARRDRLGSMTDASTWHDVVGHPAQTQAGNELTGWPASGGRRTGPGRVVDGPDDHRFRSGDVLVARTTDPSWLPLFLRAGAIVVEEGGPLSHAAIVARELRLPAVLNVPRVVDRVRGRDVDVTVDGTLGLVVVRDREPSAEPVVPKSRDRSAAVDTARGAPKPQEALARSIPARPPVELDGPRPDRLSIFVPAIMAAGLLFSLIVLLRDIVERRVGQWLALRRGALFGHQTAVVTLSGINGAKCDSVGLRSRTTYAVVGLVCCGLAGYGLPGTTFNYLRAGFYSADIAWLFAWSLLAVVFFAVVGATNLVVAARFGTVPAWTLPLLFGTPLGQTTITEDGARPGTPPEAPDSCGRWPPRRIARRIRLAGFLWSVVAIGAFLVLADVVGIPANPGGGIMGPSIAEPLQLGLLALFAAGMLIGSRWEAVGLLTMAVAAAGLGFLASVQYPSWVAVLVAAVFGVPAVLLWVAHQRSRPLRSLVALAVVTTLVLTGVWTGTSRIFGHYFGPAHPTSPLQPLPVDRVEWSWAGALASDSFTVAARLAEPIGRVRLAVDIDPALTTARYVEPANTPAEADLVARFSVDGLTASTRYTYAVEVDGRLDRVARGQITTAPTGPSSFTFAVGGCARTGSSGTVFDAIRAMNPLFFLNTGDFFYGNIDTNDISRFQAEYDASLTAPAQAALYRSTPIAYVWDDHDYGPNDADASSPSRAAAHEAYDRYVPHYPLTGQPDGPIYQAFTIGRVRFLLTDTRSDRSPETVPAADRTMLGSAQRAWLERELLAARDKYSLIIWVSPTPWIAPSAVTSDGWGGFAAERGRLSDFIADAGITNLLMLAGDAHMLAIDDGSNSDYSDRGDAGFPVFQAAPLDRPASVKGGPYSEGVSTEGGQFGLVTIEDQGGRTVNVTLSGRTYTGAEILRYQFTSGQKVE